MSFKHISWAWHQGIKHGLKPSVRVTLVALAYHAGREDTCWPSIRLLTRETGLHKRTVQVCIQQLRKLGLVAVTKRARSGGGDTSNGYKLACAHMHPPGGLTPLPPCTSHHPLFDECNKGNGNMKKPSVSDLLSQGPEEWATTKSAKEVQGELPDLSDPEPGSALRWFWVKALAVADPDAYVQAMTLKDLAMLKKIGKKIGYESAALHLPVVVEHWHKFIAHVADSAGLYGKTIPLNPSIPFVLKHALHVVSFCQTMTKPVKCEPDVKLAAPGSGEKHEAPATLEEIEATLGNIDGTSS